jgi:putative heme-binding domain-containing protein
MVPAFPGAAADDHAGDETLVDPARASVAQLVAALDHAVLPHRMRLADQIVDRFGAAAIPSVRQALPTSGSRQRVQCLWILQRLGALSPEERTQAGGDPDPLVRTHATKTLAELPQLSSLDRQLLLRQLQDSHPGTRQAAAEAAARHDDPTLIHPLLAALAGTPASDPLLRQALRIAVRNQFRNPAGWKLVVPAQLSEAERDELTDICLALTDLAAGNFIAESLARREAHDHPWEAYVPHAMRYAAGEKIAPLLSLIRQEIGSDPAAQLQLLRSLQPGPAPLPPEVRAWAKELAERLIGRPAPGESRPIAWEQLLFGEGPNADRNPWQVESRRSADGTEALFYSSLPAGERTTSRLRSAAFIAPHELSFYLAGHDGFPAQPLQQQNFVRLLDAGTQLPLRVANAPRNDTAQLVRWDLADVADRSVVLEVTDGDAATAYAWLAVGRFTYGPLNPSLHDREVQQGCELVGQFGLAECEPQLVALLESRSTALESQRAVVETLLSVHPDVRLTAVLAALQGRQPFPELWSRLVRIIAERRSLPGTSDADLAIDQLLSDTVKYVPAAGQREMAAALATDRQGIARLVELIRAGLAPGRLLTRADIQPKWQAIDDDRLKQQIAEVIAALPPEADDRESLIHDRWRRFTVGGGSAERGAVVFRTNCASCHQLAGQGSLIGPQLDGIGKRGPARLFEDILNPHRNVDIAFRTTTYVVSDGRVLTGLRRREEGSDLIVADGQGKELRIPIADIELTRESPQSLMPDNFGEILTPDQLADLAAYLTSPP